MENKKFQGFLKWPSKGVTSPQPGKGQEQIIYHGIVDGKILKFGIHN